MCQILFFKNHSILLKNSKCLSLLQCETRLRAVICIANYSNWMVLTVVFQIRLIRFFFYQIRIRKNWTVSRSDPYLKTLITTICKEFRLSFWKFSHTFSFFFKVEIKVININHTFYIFVYGSGLKARNTDHQQNAPF